MMAAVPLAGLPAVPHHRRAHLLGPVCRQQGKRAARERARGVAKAILAARPSWEVAQQRPLLQRKCSNNKWR
ncbi:unnamed protein product, partial [Ectocarpus sp. 12 AP-2014]